MHRTGRLVVASAIAVVSTAAFLLASGFGPSAAAARGAQRAIPTGLAAAIHARFGARAIRSSSAASTTLGPDFGISVALSADGTTALVGAPGVNNAKGAAYVFHASSAGSWTTSATPAATLTNGAGKKSLFGITVALSADGTTAVVGAPAVDPAGAVARGAIYVFHVSSESAWTSSSKPTATLKASQGVFVGLALALSPDGTTLVAGAPFTRAGVAYVFHVSSEDAWISTSTPTATLSNSKEAPADLLVGFAVAISGDGTTALVSDSENPAGGGAYVYHVAADDAWVSSTTPTAVLSNGDNDAHTLGSSLALSGDGTIAFLGGPNVDGGPGEVDVYRASGEADWGTTSTPAATLTHGGGSSDSAFGSDVAVSTDGTTALVTADGVAAKRGAAYVFHVQDEGAWTGSSAPTVTLTDSAGRPKDELGVGVLSADGATALLGAPGVHSATGAADVFHVPDATSWASSTKPSAKLTDSLLGACIVPRLKGLTLRAAKPALTAVRCRLGKVVKVHVRSKKSRGRVLSQSHRAGRRLGIGAKVSVRVGK